MNEYNLEAAAHVARLALIPVFLFCGTSTLYLRGLNSRWMCRGCDET